MELQDYLVVVKRYFTVIFAATLIGAVAGAALTFALPRPAPTYTSTTQGVLLTAQGAQALQESIERGTAYTATTDVLVRIPGPDNTMSDEEYTQSRINFYSRILKSPATLDSIANQSGVAVNDLRTRIEITAPASSTLLSINVSDPDSDRAESLSKALAEELARRITSIESTRSTVELLGTNVVSPTNPEVTTLLRELIVSDPLVISQQPTDAIALFGENEYQLTSQGLPLPRTPEQIQTALSLLSGLPSGSTQVEPATAEQLGTITITASDTDPVVADIIASAAMTTLQEAVSVKSGTPDTTNSPLIVTLETSAADSLTTEATPAQGNRLGVNTILGLLIGAAVGLGFAFFRASQDTTIRTARQLVELTGELPIGIIAKDTKPGSNPWMVMLTDESPAAENYRALRANLMFGMSNVKVICLTAAGSDSSAHIGVNLAVALARADQSVILVEANLHEPTVGKALSLGVSQNLNGVLAGTSTAHDAIELWAPGGISVISAENSQANASEILSTNTFTNLIEELRNLYTYVIVTTPSVLNSTDVAVVASRCDATLVLTDCGDSTTDQLEIAVTTLLQVGAPIGGVVISEVPESELNSWRTSHLDTFQTGP